MTTFHEALEGYLTGVQALEVQYHKDMGFTNLTPDRITTSHGKRYIRVIKESVEGTARSVHTFIDKTNGDILKAGSWKAPAKNGVRGNIMDSDFGLSAVDWHGAKYLR